MSDNKNNISLLSILGVGYLYKLTSWWCIFLFCETGVIGVPFPDNTVRITCQNASNVLKIVLDLEVL